MSEEENLQKFLTSEDEGMITMGLSMAKGLDLPSDILPKFLGLYFWSDNSKIRSMSKKLFFDNASSENVEIIKENWNPNIRTLKKEETVESKIKPLVSVISNTPLYSLDVFTPALFRKNPSKSYYEDPRKAIIPIIGKFGPSAEPFLMQIVKGENVDEYGYGVSEHCLDILSEIGNLKTVLKLSKIVNNGNDDRIYSGASPTEKIIKTINRILVGKEKYNKEADKAHRIPNGWSSVRNASVNIKVKPEYYTTNVEELEIIQGWLNIEFDEVHNWVAARDLGRLAFQILEQTGRTKMELCKLAITGYARDYVFSELAEINKPECLELILNLKPISTPDYEQKKLYRDSVERKTYYSTLSSLNSHVSGENLEKYKKTLLQALNVEIQEYSDTHNYKFPKYLKQIFEYKESAILESLILMIPTISVSGQNDFKKEFIDLIKGLSIESNDDILLSNIHKWDLNFSTSKSGNPRFFSPDDSRIIFSSLLAITEDIDRLDFMLDDNFSFSETKRYGNSTKPFYHEDSLDKLEKMKSSELSDIVEKLGVGNDWFDNPDDKTKIGWIKQKMPITLTKNEIERYSNVKNDGTKIKIAELIKELLGSHHYIYKNYFSEIKNEDSRKFLFSDEDATRMMGLSLSKGNKIPDEVKPIIYSIFLFDGNKDIREKAKELVTDYGHEAFPIPNEKEFMHFCSRLPYILFERPNSSGYRNSIDPDLQKDAERIIENFFSVHDNRLLSYKFLFCDLIQDTSIYKTILKNLSNNQPEEMYNYFTEFMKKNGVDFRKATADNYWGEYYKYSELVTNRVETFKFEFMLELLPEIINKVKVDFNIEQLVELIYLLRLDSKEEKSTSYDTRHRLSNQSKLFESGVTCLLQIDLASTLGHLVKKEPKDIGERTAYAHFLNLAYTLVDDEAREKIRDMATPYVKDRSSHVRKYIKEIIQ